MTPEDRDALRAETAMRILAAMYSGYRPRDMPTDLYARKAWERTDSKRRMLAALEAATAADTLIAELQIREEFHGNNPDSIEALVAAGVAGGGQILTCKHGRTSFEECGKCDAEAAEKEKAGESGAVAPAGNS